MCHARVYCCRILLLFPVVVIMGCATVNARRDYQRAGSEVERAVGQVPLENPEDQAITHAAIAELMTDGLTADEAVKLALLNNPRARAVLLQVGMARADVVQAGLWSNPTMGFSFNLPTGGGSNQFGMNLAQNIADLWMIPSRSRAANQDLDRMTLNAAQELVSLAVDTKVAYFNALAADSAFSIAQDNVSLTEELLRITNARLEAGTVGSLDVNLARGQALRAKVEARSAQLESASSRRTLAALLGLTTSAQDLLLRETLPEPMESELPVDRYVAAALDSRLDARAARDAVEAAAARVELELAKVFQNVEVGLEVEHQAHRAQGGRKILADTARTSIANGQLTAPEIQSRGQRNLEERQRIDAILGPSLSLTLPIFDQNQAQIAKARMSYLESKAMLEGLERGIVQDTREAADRLSTAWNVATLYQNEVLPQAQETLDLSQSTYQAGQTTILNVIDAQRSLLETRRANVAALQAAANAIAELERATARPVAELLELVGPSTQPTQTQTTDEG
ncbi:MAG: TolC family protein [Planctomycetes bacterium]|nr:TolC family protein [Planctomycetota bacterium]